MSSQHGLESMSTQSSQNNASLSFELVIRQQPVRSRMCGIGERVDRRPIDPPPIVELKLKRKNDENKNLICIYIYVCVCICLKVFSYAHLTYFLPRSLFPEIQKSQSTIAYP
ncbi:hypothetical protein CLU79DRAFT_272715 [Phycomyces nitens]|nr:hypothetical protein CLU79DRAFT_272715 [Phycomyces nitens]